MDVAIAQSSDENQSVVFQATGNANTGTVTYKGITRPGFLANFMNNLPLNFSKAVVSPLITVFEEYDDTGNVTAYVINFCLLIPTSSMAEPCIACFGIANLDNDVSANAIVLIIGFQSKPPLSESYNLFTFQGRCSNVQSTSPINRIYAQYDEATVPMPVGFTEEVIGLPTTPRGTVAVVATGVTDPTNQFE